MEAFGQVSSSWEILEGTGCKIKETLWGIPYFEKAITTQETRFSETDCILRLAIFLAGTLFPYGMFQLYYNALRQPMIDEPQKKLRNCSDTDSEASDVETTAETNSSTEI